MTNYNMVYSYEFLVAKAMSLHPRMRRRQVLRSTPGKTVYRHIKKCVCV